MVTVGERLNELLKHYKAADTLERMRMRFQFKALLEQTETLAAWRAIRDLNREDELDILQGAGMRRPINDFVAFRKGELLLQRLRLPRD